MSRVREEARSPLGLTAFAPSVVTCALVGLLVLADFAGTVVVAGVVLLVQLVLAASPPPVGVTRAPARSPKVGPIALSGLVAAAVTLVSLPVLRWAATPILISVRCSQPRSAAVCRVISC